MPGFSIQRGDVVWADVPLITDPTQSKLRPVLVIQNDIGNRYSPSLIVATISSQIPTRYYPTDYFIDVRSHDGRLSGLDRDSIVSTSSILTLPKTRIRKVLGRLSEQAMEAVDNCLRVSLGLR